MVKRDVDNTWFTLKLAKKLSWWFHDLKINKRCEMLHWHFDTSCKISLNFFIFWQSSNTALVKNWNDSCLFHDPNNFSKFHYRYFFRSKEHKFQISMTFLWSCEPCNTFWQRINSHFVPSAAFAVYMWLARTQFFFKPTTNKNAVVHRHPLEHKATLAFKKCDMNMILSETT